MTESALRSHGRLQLQIKVRTSGMKKYTKRAPTRIHAAKKMYVPQVILLSIGGVMKAMIKLLSSKCQQVPAWVKPNWQPSLAQKTE
jgi:hypothetical protein